MPPIEERPATATVAPSPAESSASPSARTCLARFQRGDREAFRELEALLRSSLRRFCCRHLDDELAGEAYQETWIRVFRFASRFEPGRDVRAWIFSIARRVCADVQRRESVHRAAPETEIELQAPGGQLTERPEAPAGTLEQRERIASVRTCLGTLGARYREVVDLWLADLSHASIAEVLRIPEGTSAWRLATARRQLRECLRRAGFGPERSAASGKERGR